MHFQGSITFPQSQPPHVPKHHANWQMGSIFAWVVDDNDADDNDADGDNVVDDIVVNDNLGWHAWRNDSSDACGPHVLTHLHLQLLLHHLHHGHLPQDSQQV